jgi:hypothetical protein
VRRALGVQPPDHAAIQMIAPLSWFSGRANAAKMARIS